MPAAHGGSVLTPAQVLYLQHAIGNQRVAKLLQPARVPSADSSVMRFGEGPGQPLEPSVRMEMQSRLGHDLSRVRIHTDARAAASAQAMGAAAYTVGQDVSFATGRYAPHTEPGQRLLAHELTHAVQQAGSAAPRTTAAPATGLGRAAEIEADDNAERIAGGTPAQINVAAPVGVAAKGAGNDPAASRSYWFQSKPPEKPVKTESGIEITPKGQVVVEPASPVTIQTSRGAVKVRFAGLDSDFQGDKPTPAFAAAEKAVIDAIRGAIEDLGALPEIKDAPSMKAARAQQKADETARARLLGAERTLHGRTLNIFIASDLSVAEKMSKAPLTLSTEQIFVRAKDIGDPAKLEAAIRVPLVRADRWQPRNRRRTRRQAEGDHRAGPDDRAGEGGHAPRDGPCAPDQPGPLGGAGLVGREGRRGDRTGRCQALGRGCPVPVRARPGGDLRLFGDRGRIQRVRGQQDGLRAVRGGGRAVLTGVGAKLDTQKPVPIKVTEKIGEEKEGRRHLVDQLQLPKAVKKVGAEHLDMLKTLQEADKGS